MRLLIGIGVLAVVAVGVFLVVGTGESKSEKAMAQVCASRADISKHVTALKGLTPATVTTEAVATSLDAIRGDLKNIADARADLADENRDEVEQANQAFASTVRETAATVARSISAAEAAGQLQTAAQALATAYEGTYGVIDCS
jgi:hypothetical protein